ncbi:hypothetical protein [Deefgea rivuli]|uniref:hypothetical protein n=1 Tax=Deefgea rivuli TaxID=400948 RepID=UPI000684B40A|nr:hypothetical protein [Deefgea rivuli]
MKQWIIKIVIGHIVLLSLGFGFVAYQLGWFKQWMTETPTQIINVSCADLSLGCTFKIDQQEYKIKSPHTISTSKPVQIQLTGPAKNISLSWQMLGMDMASNRYKMLGDDQNIWHAETMLPLCSQQRLDWILTLNIDQTKVLLQTQSAATHN